MTTLFHHPIKVNRALRLAGVGDCPRSAAAMLDALPSETVVALTARQLADLLDAMWRLAGASRVIAERDAVDAGCVWDERAGRMRGLSA